MELKTYFNLDLLISNDEYNSFDFMKMKDRNWVKRYEPTIYIKFNETTDLISEEN